MTLTLQFYYSYMFVDFLFLPIFCFFSSLLPYYRIPRYPNPNPNRNFFTALSIIFVDPASLWPLKPLIHFMLCSYHIPLCPSLYPLHFIPLFTLFPYAFTFEWRPSPSYLTAFITFQSCTVRRTSKHKMTHWRKRPTTGMMEWFRQAKVRV